jgi:hypothetical protein
MCVFAVWIVEISMPKKLMQDVYVGINNQENNKMAEFMKYRTDASASTDEVAQESPENAETPPPPAA